MMRRWLCALLMLLLLLISAPSTHGQASPASSPLPASPSAEDLRRTVMALMSPDRSPGTAGAQKAADVLAARLGQATGQRVYRQRFTLVVPEVQRCEASGPGGEKLPLWPMFPLGAQAPALPGQQATAEVVYGGSGKLEELRGKTVARHWVALELASDTAWQTVAGLGARGVIFLGGPETRVQAFLDKDTAVPLGVPRFYCDDPATVAAFRAGKIPSLTIATLTRWVEKDVDNLLCLIPGRQTARDYPNARKGWTEQLVVLQARYDAMSQVMTRAPGAEQAAAAATLVDLAGRIAAMPNRCSVLVALTGGDAWLYRGTRILEELLRPEQKDLKQALASLHKTQAALEDATRRAGGLAAGLEALAGREFSRLKDPMLRQAVRDQVDREPSALEEKLERVRLGEKVYSPTGQELNRTKLEAQKEHLLNAAAVVQGARPITGTEDVLAQAAESLVRVFRREHDRRAHERDNHANWAELRTMIGPRVPLVHFEMALSSHGQTFGFFARSAYLYQNDQTGKMDEFSQALRRYHGDLRSAAEKRSPTAREPLRFDPGSTIGDHPLNTYLPIREGFSIDAALTRGQAAGAFATIQDAAAVIDTPNDTPERVDYANLAAQAGDLARLLVGDRALGVRGALADPLFYGRTELTNNTNDQPVKLLERTLGETTPRLGAAEVLIGGWHEKEKDNRAANPGPLMGTRRFEFMISHPVVRPDDYSVVFTAVQRHEFRLQSLDFDEDGMPRRALVQNQSEQRGLVDKFTADPLRPQRAMLFDCQRLDLLGLFDPRYMEYLDRLDVLDARRLDKAQFTNTYVRDGLAAVFMPPGIRWQLLVSKGDVTNRMVLINADRKHPEGQGFATTDLAELGPLAWRNARDMYALDSKRKEDLERFGISNEVISDLHARSARALETGAKARDEQDYRGWLGAAAAAWSLQEQVYANLISTSNGIIKGVIFLLLGVIPFSYFLERLVIGATTVYKQIAWFAAIFAVMTLALWGHPAFRISNAPLMILLAFLILILSGTVVYILWGKFEEEVSRLRGAAAASHTASLKRGAVLGAAIRLGLSNMRRRGMRTTLTLVTLVLLTFTLLCFTSVRESVQLTPRAVEDAPHRAPPGILLRMRGWRAMPAATVPVARELAGAEGQVSLRVWYSSERPEQRWMLPVVDAPPGGLPGSDKTFGADGLVGIDPREALFQPADMESVLPGWRRLVAGEPVCFLPADLREMGFKVDDTVRIMGTALTIAGFFDTDGFLKLRQLTGDEMTPTDPTGSAAAPGSTQSTTPEELAALPEATYRYLSPRAVAVVPVDLALRLGGRLTSIMIRPGDPADAEAVAENLARRSAFTVYVSDGESVRSLNAVESTRPQNLEKVLVPLIIAAVIVLNTMLGAVAERTREIHVYTSVGLAPAHVGMLFLAEAAALGTLGVVFGYIFGQALATFLSHTRLMAGVDLNYSSMAAVFTMGLVLGIVMLSSLWPARSATRVAAPSLQRDWKLPAARGDLLIVELPFTVNQVAARGVCAFLDEFFRSTSQAGTGRFTADHIRAFEVGGIRGLTCRIWLAPYDLGVIQTLWLAIHPTTDPHVFEVRLTLLREAGNPNTWHRLNRPFLVEVRKQFLLWRAVRPELIDSYLKRSAEMFQDAEHALPPTEATLANRLASPEGLRENSAEASA